MQGDTFVEKRDAFSDPGRCLLEKELESRSARKMREELSRESRDPLPLEKETNARIRQSDVCWNI